MQLHDDTEQLVKAQEEEEEELISHITKVLSTEQGRSYLYTILERCHIFHTSFVPGSPAADVAFREGERNVGLQILNDLMLVDRDILSKLLKERK